MRLKTFLSFVGPSVLSMVALIAIPLVGVVYLALHSSHVKTEVVEVKSTVPLFGGMKKTIVKKVPQPVLDENGNPIKVWEYTGVENLRSVADPEALSEAFTKDRSVDGAGKPQSLGERLVGLYRDVTDVDFWGAMEFTLLYAFVTTPFILVLGFFIALAVDSTFKWLKGVLIFTSLLPFIVTPVVGALSVYWLFLDSAVVAATLEQLGLGKIYFLKDAVTIRSLIIMHGIWHSTPFAFVVLYAGLQTVPKSSLEAAVVDGATYWQRIRYIVIPYLAPLFIFIGMIHIMDAYRVFEPVLVFAANLFANSVQYWTYYIINFEDNFHKAAASSILTVAGITFVLIPIVIRTYREHKRG